MNFPSAPSTENLVKSDLAGRFELFAITKPKILYPIDQTYYHNKGVTSASAIDRPKRGDVRARGMSNHPVK